MGSPCECGCGGTTSPGKRFIQGHDRKGVPIIVIGGKEATKCEHITYSRGPDHEGGAAFVCADCGQRIYRETLHKWKIVSEAK